MRKDDDAVKGVALKRVLGVPTAEQTGHVMTGRTEPQAEATELTAQVDSDHASIEGVETGAVDESTEFKPASNAKPVVDLSRRFEPAFTRSRGRSSMTALMADAA